MLRALEFRVVAASSFEASMVRGPEKPAGSELAARTSDLDGARPSPAPPDPTGRVTRDEGFVDAEVTAVPRVVAPGEPTRVHVVLRPRARTKTHWNNEAGPTEVWLDLPEGWNSDGPLHSVPVPQARASTETRRVEIELRGPTAPTGRVRIPGHAVYYVCEDVRGTCLYRRRDLEVELDVAPP